VSQDVVLSDRAAAEEFVRNHLLDPSDAPVLSEETERGRHRDTGKRKPVSELTDEELYWIRRDIERYHLAFL